MKKFNALFVFASLFFVSVGSANSFMYPFTSQKTQQQKGQAQTWPIMQQPITNQPWASQFPPTYSYPQMRQPIAAYPYAMPYSNTAMPPVLRFPPSQTFQQAQPAYNVNQPYRIPMQASPYMQQYGYPVGSQQTLVPRVNNQQVMNQQNRRPPYRKPVPIKKKKRPWGDIRYIWPDFYTDATGDMWDNMMNAPYDMGRMPGGWRAPSLSSPDPVTVGDAVANQFPPIMEEMPNFMPFMN